jgi:hypothetical protein
MYKNMKYLFRLLLIISALFYARVSHSQNIYGLANKYFVSMNISENTHDTLIVFNSNATLNLGFRSAIDRFNGWYFYGGNLPGQVGTFHIIDLVDLTIASHDIVVDNIEYDFLRHRLISEKNGKLHSIDLATMQVETIGVIETGNSSIYGQKRTFVPQMNRFFYIDNIYGPISDPYFLSIDANTAEVLCSPKAEANIGGFYVPGGIVTNNLTGDIIGHINGTYGMVDPCSGTITQLSQISDYRAHLNNQMAVYNHIDNTYIIPYASNITDSHYKIAIVDVYNNEILKTIIQPFNGRMNLQQIYDKPEAPLIHLNDTLFVPFGDDYRWYLDGEFIGETYVNYFIPQVSGKYKAEVDFREYTTFSAEVEVLLTSANKITKSESINIYPNPAENFIKLDLGYYKNVNIKMLDLGGKVVRRFNVNDQSELTIDLNGLSDGVYLVSVQTEKGIFKQLVIKQ